MKRLITISLVFLAQFNALSQCNEQLGNGSQNLNKSPFYGLYDYSQSGFIYTEAQLATMGIYPGSVLTEIEFQFSGWSTGYTVNNQTIKMGTTTAISFPILGNPNPDYSDLLNVSSLQTVKNNFTYVIPSNEDWENFPFDAPFTYNGDNLIISWENRDGSWNSGYGWIEGKSTSYYRTLDWYKDGSYPTISNSNYSRITRQPNLRFEYTDVISNPGNITICDSYTLPTITGSNLSGLEAYYNDSQTNGGTPISGNVTTSQTVWIYDGGNLCSEETSFAVTINYTPVADAPADVNACDSYALPSLTVGNYFTNPNGVGSVAAGSSIITTQTLYVYAETATTPNCTNENSFAVTINYTPVADAPADVTACDSYTLPSLTVGNYFTNPNGVGPVAAGTSITTTQTLYVYAETATTPNCTSENAFAVTINYTPVADAPADVTACDSYTLPSLTVGNYFTNPNGVGSVAAGTSITTTQTLYVYAETATTPNCTNENAFAVTINYTPVADAPANVAACDSYTLPSLTVGNYFSSPNGVGSVAAGSSITTTQTLYVYAETATTPNCTNENSFAVTINYTPVADAPADVTACDSYTLPSLTVGNYFSSPNGVGPVAAGTSITTTQTLYVYAETATAPNCTNENAFAVTINYTPVADAPADVTACDSYTLPSLNVGNYFSSPNGVGSVAAGSSIITTQTLYVYAETATTPNCTSENAFAITINYTPVADAPADITACDSYTLPSLAVGNYFTNPNGVGPVAAGTSITTAQTLYVYAETATTPNCTNENAFAITINYTPVADAPADVTACDSYTLPSLAVGNYFSSPNGVGPVAAGTSITTTQTLYVYAETATTPNCTSENSFAVTINYTPVADAPADITACDSYTLPSLAVGNYFTNPNGVGPVTAGSFIDSTQTLYVYAESGTLPNCANENSFTINIDSCGSCSSQWGDGSYNIEEGPFYGLYDYSQSGYIYTESQLAAIGYVPGSVITEISFQLNGWSTGYSVDNQVLKMGTTSLTEFPNTANNPIDYSDLGVNALNQVKDSFSIVIPPQENWMTFTFDTPFTYTGDNLLISWENHDGSWASGYGWLEGTNLLPSHMSHSWYNDNSYPTMPSNHSSGGQPNIKFGNSPFLENPGNVTACNEYYLPVITGYNLSGNQGYYDDNQANNGALIYGPITTSQLIWIYDYNGTCSDEESFEVIITTIDASTSLSGATVTGNLFGANYTWLDCENNYLIISGQNTQTFTAFENGSYAVIVNDGLCLDTSECVIVNTVSIFENNLEEISVYPNPTNNIINIKIANYPNEFEARIYDLSGRLLLIENKSTFSINSFSKGIYMLRLVFADRVKDIRIVKE